MNFKKSIITITSIAALSLGVQAFAQTPGTMGTTTPTTKHVIRQEIKKVNPSLVRRNIMASSTLSRVEKKEIKQDSKASTTKKMMPKRINHRVGKNASSTKMWARTATSTH